MIQRIQTLYLLGSFVLIIAMFFFPLAELIDASGKAFQFIYRGIPSITEGEPAVFYAYPVAILLTIITLISLYNGLAKQH